MRLWMKNCTVKSICTVWCLLSVRDLLYCFLLSGVYKLFDPSIHLSDLIAIMASAIVNGILVQGLSDENDNSSNTKEQIYMNGTATDTSDLLKSETVSTLFILFIISWFLTFFLLCKQYCYKQIGRGTFINLLLKYNHYYKFDRVNV